MIRKLFRKYREIIVYAIFGAATTLPLFPFAVNDKLCTAGRDGGIREVAESEIDGID